MVTLKSRYYASDHPANTGTVYSIKAINMIDRALGTFQRTFSLPKYLWLMDVIGVVNDYEIFIVLHCDDYRSLVSQLK